MKRFWLMMLSLGFVMAFSVSAFAVDVKVSGSFYVGGLYLNKISVNDNYSWTGTDNKTYTGNPSTAFFYQRLRVGTDFIVSPGLKLVTRFDALERIWGGTRSAAGTTLAGDSAGTAAENENIAFDWAYIDYVSPIGTLDAGYMELGNTGTVFGNTTYPGGRIKYTTVPFGPFVFNAKISKTKDTSYSYVTSSATPATTWTNGDKTQYAVEGKYNFKDGFVGLQIQYNDYADTEPGSSGYAAKYTVFTPYVIAKLGPVNLQAEVNYALGKYKAYDSGLTGPDVSIDNLTAFLDATANFAPIYVGGTFAYVSGDDPNTTDKNEGGTLNGGTDWNPCLILFSYYDLTNWVGAVNGYNSGKVNDQINGRVDGPMYNAWFFQGRVGVKPIPELDVMLSLSYAQADKKPAGFTGGAYGTEVDLTGTYKITNNLSYMLGAGYLFTGDYFKGTNGSNKIDDDYMLINKLTLTF